MPCFCLPSVFKGPWFAAVGVFLGALRLAAAQAEELRVPEQFPTIQKAIDAASPGDTVSVAAGTYHEYVRLKPHVTLRSRGNDERDPQGRLLRAVRTILDGRGRPSRQPGVQMAPGAVLDGFTVTGIGPYDQKRWAHHHATAGEEQDHHHIGAPGTPGVAVTGVDCVVQNNIVHHNGYSGIAVSGKWRPLVRGNFCFRNMGAGIACMDGAGGIVTENVCYENFYAGIGHRAASPLVEGNRCYGNIRAGIGISQGACPVVRNNRCYANRRAGIGIRTTEATRPLVQGNHCYQNHMAGIGVRDQAAPVLRGNRCYRNELAGIGSRTRARLVAVENECYENGQAGIGQRADAQVLLVRNHCHRNRTAGIGFAACKQGRAVLIENHVHDNQAAAVGIHAGWKVLMEGNRLRRASGMPPVVMIFQGAEATLVDNHLQGPGVAAVRVAGHLRAQGNVFDGGQVRRRGPPDFGIWALPGAELTLIGNRFRGWRHALLAEAPRNALVVQNQVRQSTGVAIRIQAPARGVVVAGNTILSANKQAQAAVVEGTGHTIQGNRVQAPPANEPARP